MTDRFAVGKPLLVSKNIIVLGGGAAVRGHES